MLDASNSRSSKKTKPKVAQLDLVQLNDGLFVSPKEVVRIWVQEHQWGREWRVLLEGDSKVGLFGNYDIGHIVSDETAHGLLAMIPVQAVDLMLLCRFCHDEIHASRQKQPS